MTNSGPLLHVFGGAAAAAACVWLGRRSFAFCHCSSKQERTIAAAFWWRFAGFVQFAQSVKCTLRIHHVPTTRQKELVKNECALPLCVVAVISLFVEPFELISPSLFRSLANIPGSTTFMIPSVTTHTLSSNRLWARRKRGEG